MTQVLRIGDHIIKEAEIISLLALYQMLPQLWHELVIDSAITSIELTPEEYKSALEQFDKKHELTNVAARQAWCVHYGMTQKQQEALATRELRIEKFKVATWEPKLESCFLTHKSKLDKVIYSLIRTTNAVPLQSGMSVNANIKVRSRKAISIFTDLFAKSVESLKTVR